MLTSDILRVCLLYSLLVPAALAGTVVLLVCGWLAYLRVCRRFDSLRLLPGANDGGPEQVQHENVEIWAKKRANGTPSHTPRNLKVPGLWPFDKALRLVTMDPQIVAHILTSSNFVKPLQSRTFLTKLLGNGLFNAEGAEHRFLRKAYSQAFYPSVLRSLENHMFQKADQLCEIWSQVETDDAGEVTLDVQSPLNRAALDVVAVAGFGQDLNSVTDPAHPVYNAYRNMLDYVELCRGPMFKFFLSLNFSWWHSVFPDEISRTFDESHATILRFGRSLLQQDGGRSEKSPASKDDPPTSLVQSIINDSSESTKVSDTELLGHFSTFLFNGADSVGSTIAWTLHHLSHNQELQQSLRAELASTHDNVNRIAALEGLPILTSVVCETLRFRPPLPSTIRVTQEDEVLRASEDIILSNGSVTRDVFVKKGTMIHIPILAMNTLTDFWGPDANKYNADRWKNLPAEAKTVPGVLQTMAFTFGPHGCPGYKIALSEIRIFVAAIVRQFEIHPAADIRCSNVFMSRPFVKGQFDAKGIQLPLRLKRITL